MLSRLQSICYCELVSYKDTHIHAHVCVHMYAFIHTGAETDRQTDTKKKGWMDGKERNLWLFEEILQPQIY